MAAPSARDQLSEDKGPAIIACLASVTSIATVFVGARLFVRARILGTVHWDDFLIVLSVIFGWIFTAVTIAAVYRGDGRHTQTLSEEQISGALLWTIIGFVPGVMSFCIPKIAVVALLTRLLSPGKLHRIFLWSIALLSLANLVIDMIILFSQCRPIESQWDRTITKKTCWSPNIMVDFSIWCGAFSAAVDLYLSIYPATVLWNLQLSTRKKIGLSAALGVGSIATVVAIYKCTRLPSLGSQDFIYDTADLVIWTSIESSTLIIASCIPMLQPLVDLVTGKRTLSRGVSEPAYGRSGGAASGKSQPRSSPFEPAGLEWSKRRAAPDTTSSDLEPGRQDSQETILGLGEVQARNPEFTPMVEMPGIMKTHTITISYDLKDDVGSLRSADNPANWRPS